MILFDMNRTFSFFFKSKI